MNRFAMSGLIILSLGTYACTSTEEVEDVDTKLEVKGNVESKTLGLNDDGEAILQEEVAADDELLLQQRYNLELEDDLRHERTVLDSCIVDMSDPRLGGDGEFRDMQLDLEKSDPGEVREEFGLSDDGSLVVVRRESYVQRLNTERKYEKRLKQLIDQTTRHRKKCEQRMRIARVKAGLPADRYRAEGQFDDQGRWHETRKAEASVDDAFEIKNMNSAAGQ